MRALTWRPFPARIEAAAVPGSVPTQPQPVTMELLAVMDEGAPGAGDQAAVEGKKESTSGQTRTPSFYRDGVLDMEVRLVLKRSKKNE